MSMRSSRGGTVRFYPRHLFPAFRQIDSVVILFIEDDEAAQFFQSAIQIRHDLLYFLLVRVCQLIRVKIANSNSHSRGPTRWNKSRSVNDRVSGLVGITRPAVEPNVMKVPSPSASGLKHYDGF
jgi:hypothetical protein